MFFFNQKSVESVNFEFIQDNMKKQEFVLLNTLPNTEQNILIYGTIIASKEEECINKMMSSFNEPDKKIIVYGKNYNDNSAVDKCKQLKTIGIDCYLYRGGLFEWMLLQDIYGEELFPTTNTHLDLFLFKPCRSLIFNL